MSDTSNNSIVPEIWLEASLKRFHRVQDKICSSISFRIVSDCSPIKVRLEPRDGQDILLRQSQAHVEPQFNHWFRNGIYLAGEESVRTKICTSEPLLYFECRCTIDATTDQKQAIELAEAYKRFIEWLAREFHIVYVHSQGLASKVLNINVSERLVGFEEQLKLDIDHMKSLQFNPNHLCAI